MTEAVAPDARHLALVVLHTDAVAPVEGRPEYGTYDIYVPENLDERIETTIYDGLREALVTARSQAPQHGPPGRSRR